MTGNVKSNAAVIDSERLARKLLYSLYEELAESQDKVIKLEARKARFGDAAMPNYQGSTDCLKRSGEGIARELELSNEHIAENIETIKVLEEIMERQDAADMAAFGDFIRQRYGERQKKKPAKGE